MSSGYTVPVAIVRLRAPGQRQAGRGQAPRSRRRRRPAARRGRSAPAAGPRPEPAATARAPGSAPWRPVRRQPRRRRRQPMPPPSTVHAGSDRGQRERRRRRRRAPPRAGRAASPSGGRSKRLSTCHTKKRRTITSPFEGGASACTARIAAWPADEPGGDRHRTRRPTPRALAVARQQCHDARARRRA